MPAVTEMRVGHIVKYQNSKNGDLIASPKLGSELKKRQFNQFFIKKLPMADGGFTYSSGTKPSASGHFLPAKAFLNASGILFGTTLIG